MSNPQSQEGTVPELQQFELVGAGSAYHLLPKGMYPLPESGTVLVELDYLKEAEQKLGEVERQRDEQSKHADRYQLAYGRMEDRAEKAEAALAEALKLAKGGAEVIASVGAALSERDKQVREVVEELDEEVCRRRSCATGLAEEENCTDITPSEFREKERLESEADRLGELVDQLREALPQASSTPLQQDPEVGEDGEEGFALLANELGDELHRIGGTLEVLSKDEGIEFFAREALRHDSAYLRRVSTLLTQPEADPEVPRCGLEAAVVDVISDLERTVEEIRGTPGKKGVCLAFEHIIGKLRPHLRSDCQSTPELLGEEVAKALKVLALGWYDDGLLPDDLAADESEDEGLLATGRDITDEGFCYVTKEGEEYVRGVLARLVTTASTQPESPGNSGEKVVFPTHRVAALFGRDDRNETRQNLIGRVERDVEDLADQGEHLAAATERMGLELVLRPATQPVPGNSGNLCRFAIAIAGALGTDDAADLHTARRATADLLEALAEKEAAGNSGGVEEGIADEGEMSAYERTRRWLDASGDPKQTPECDCAKQERCDRCDEPAASTQPPSPQVEVQDCDHPLWFERNENGRLEELRNGDEPGRGIVLLTPLRAHHAQALLGAIRDRGEDDDLPAARELLRVVVQAEQQEDGR